ncbi:hypothetical protein C8R45DRAFT_1179083 [Mycena sanguinolenta]|nr:hypothetical protein C8R45DRAFT_1179083 [Mycena sanguinolenta]
MIAVLALIMLALLLSSFLIDNETNLPVGILYASGRVYVISMLMNLKIRPSGRPQSWTTNGGQRGTVRFTDGPTYNFTTVPVLQAHKYISQLYRPSVETSASGCQVHQNRIKTDGHTPNVLSAMGTLPAIPHSHKSKWSLVYSHEQSFRNAILIEKSVATSFQSPLKIQSG